ncbi:MAG: hypothetical protein LBM06_00470 [Prevotellaceae bacterium]|jgi:hypothetical protein|nr:hypothetical protein [Prevotellaceae bacterium]
MKMKMNVLHRFLPSLFFISVALLCMIKSSWPVMVVMGGVALLLALNIRRRNKTIDLITGIVFLLCAVFMLMALGSDFHRGTASWGYLFGLFMALLGATMSVLLICRPSAERRHPQLTAK